MLKLFMPLLTASRKRRRLLAGLAILLLSAARDVEEAEMSRHSDELDRLGPTPIWGDARRSYDAVEEVYQECECSIGFLECAIDDLKFAY